MATYVHGKGAVFSMDNAAGTLVDYSAVVTEAKVSISLDTADTSHFGSSAKTYIAGQNDASGNVSGLFDRTLVGTLTASFNALMASTSLSLTVELGPEGSATGATKISGEYIMTSLEIGAAVGDAVHVSFNLQRTGATIFGTY